MAWLILALVFVDEVLAVIATSIWGAYAGGWPLAVAAPVVAVAAWWAFASPKAPYGGSFVRPLVKVVVFGLASAGLYAAGHEGWALALLVFSILINACAELAPVRAVLANLEGRSGVS